MARSASAPRPALDSAALAAARVIGAIAATAVFALSAHELSFADFGLVASTIAAGFLANTLVTFGTDTVVTRSVARNPGAPSSDATASLTFQLAGALTLITLAAVAVAAGVQPVVLVQAAVLIPLAFVTVSGSALRGRQHMTPLFSAAAASGVVAFVATALGFAVWSSPVVPVASLGLGAIAAAGLQLRALRRPGGGPWRTATASRKAVSSHVRDAAPFAAMVVLAAVGAQGGLLLIEAFADDTTGGYGAAIRVVEAGRLVPAAVIGAWFPTLATTSGPPDRYRRWLAGILGYSLVVAGALLVCAGFINRLVFDDQPGGGGLIAILALSLPLTVVRLALSFEAIAVGRERIVLISAIVGTVVLLIGGVIGARASGATGVAWSHTAGIAASVVVLGVDWFRSTSAAPSPADASARVGAGKRDVRSG